MDLQGIARQEERGIHGKSPCLTVCAIGLLLVMTIMMRYAGTHLPLSAQVRPNLDRHCVRVNVQASDGACVP